MRYSPPIGEVFKATSGPGAGREPNPRKRQRIIDCSAPPFSIDYKSLSLVKKAFLPLIRMVKFVWLMLVVVISQASIYVPGLVNASQGPEAYAARSYFYVGGQYVDVLLTPLYLLPIAVRVVDQSHRMALVCITTKIRCTWRSWSLSADQGKMSLSFSYKVRPKQVP